MALSVGERVAAHTLPSSVATTLLLPSPSRNLPILAHTVAPPPPASDSAPSMQSHPSLQFSWGSPPCPAHLTPTRLPSAASRPHAPCPPRICGQFMHSSSEVREGSGDWGDRDLMCAGLELRCWSTMRGLEPQCGRFQG
jgi:hypothetical protein